MLQSVRPRCRALVFACLSAFSCHLATAPASAIVVHGTVTDPLGAAIPNATVALVQNGAVLVNGKSGSDGSYQISSSVSGRFFVLVGGTSFRQLATQSFYGGQLDSVEQNVVLEPDWVRQEVVVTATGTPLPQAQTSASINVLGKSDFENRAELNDPFRQMPGTAVVQTGERGGLTSVFVRGGNSDANKFLVDGVPINDIGGRFDLSTVATTGVSTAEVYRGPNSVLYGSDASAGVIGFTTPRGTTNFPSLFYEGDAGNFGTYRNQLQLGGTLRTLDYFGGLSALYTQNSLPMDEYHNITGAANVGWAPTGSTSLRVTARNGDIATGLPGAYGFYNLSNDGKQSDQDTYLSGTIDHTSSDLWHSLVRYGLARKREQSVQWYPAGNLIDDNYFGNFVTIKGANGYRAAGQAILNFSTDFGSVYPNNLDLVSNRDNLYAQTDYHFTPHIVALAGFRFENERGAERLPAFGISEAIERTNYDYLAQIQGDWKGRLFYSFGGGVQKNQLYGTEGTPRVGVSYYAVRPGPGKFHGTKINFNFSKGVKEPTLSDQFGSLFDFLQQHGGQAAIAQFHVSPIGAEQSRSYDGGVEQSFFSEHVLLHATYFHNEFGRQIESVGAGVVPQLLPNLDASQQAALQAFLTNENAFALDLNSLAFSAQGVESEVQYGITRSIFLRGGYTYLDTKVQDSFSSDALAPTFNTGLANGQAPSFSNIPIGVFSPLRGARPFRRPPHTGFVTATYAGKHWSGAVQSAFASRSDDSTFLGGIDIHFGNSLLLPNRNLDYGFAKVDVGVTYQFTPWLAIYTQQENFLSQQHIGPIGYPSLPFTFRTGLRFSLGHEKK
jgi:vitamin B12 transporter